MSVENESIQGDLSVSGETTIGGNMTVRGNSTFDHNVTIKGWLRAKNIVGTCKGLFKSSEALENAYPEPESGWWALVGDTLPAAVYRAEDGAWVATGGQGGDVSLDLNQFNEDFSALNDRVSSLEESESSQNETISEMGDTISSHYSYFNTQYNMLVESISGINNKNTQQDSDILDLQNAVWPLTLSFSASSTLLEYTGEDKSITLNWTITRNGTTVTPTSVVITAGETEVYNGTDNPGSVAVSLNVAGAQTYKISVTADGLTSTGTVSVRMLPPIYCGFSEIEGVEELSITSLTKQSVKTSIAGTYTLTNSADGGYLWICSPDLVGKVSRVTLNGFDVPMEEVQDGSTGLSSYYCYRSSNALVAGSYTFVVE